MRKSIPATIMVLLVLTMILGFTGSALADTYTYTGLGGGGTPLSLASNGSNVFAGMESGHVWRSSGDGTWYDAGGLDGGTINALVWDGANIYAGTSNGQTIGGFTD